MTDDLSERLSKILKDLSDRKPLLQNALTALEITNTLKENESKILSLMGQPVVIRTLESNHRGGISQDFLRVTALSMEVLQGKMKALRHLDPSPSKVLTLNIKGMVDGLMRPTKDNTGTPVITISLMDSGRT
jgi:hypothetical protein